MALRLNLSGMGSNPMPLVLHLETALTASPVSQVSSTFQNFLTTFPVNGPLWNCSTSSFAASSEALNDCLLVRSAVRLDPSWFRSNAAVLPASSFRYWKFFATLLRICQILMFALLHCCMTHSWSFNSGFKDLDILSLLCEACIWSSAKKAISSLFGRVARDSLFFFCSP